MTHICVYFVSQTTSCFNPPTPPSAFDLQLSQLSEVGVEMVLPLFEWPQLVACCERSPVGHRLDALRRCSPNCVFGGPDKKNLNFVIEFAIVLCI